MRLSVLLCIEGSAAIRINEKDQQTLEMKGMQEKGAWLVCIEKSVLGIAVWHLSAKPYDAKQWPIILTLDL